MYVVSALLTTEGKLEVHMNTVELAKRTTDPYIGGVLKSEQDSLQWRITSITHWSLSDSERYMMIGYVPEDNWAHARRYETKIRLAACPVSILGIDQMMMVHCLGQTYVLYPPTHSVDSLEFQLMLLTPAGVGDN